jgi:AcrR family transcriptional regulator
MKSPEPESRKTRHYDGSRRQDEARARRRAVVEAAHDLFLSRGYGSVTIQEIARQAGVSSQMVYAAFGSKAGILEQAVDMAITGDDEEIPLFEREEIQQRLSSDDPREFLRGINQAGRIVHERSAPILHIVESVAGSDPAVEELRTKYNRQRKIDTRRILEALPRQGMRQDLDFDALVDFIDHIGRSESYVALVVESGWSPERYQSWFEEVMYRVVYEPD